MNNGMQWVRTSKLPKVQPHAPCFDLDQGLIDITGLSAKMLATMYAIINPPTYQLTAG